MRVLLYTVSILSVVLLAFWAYREGYATRATERQVRDLHRQIAQAEAELAMLNAEWAYLNRPERLRILAEMNFERLGLMPLAATHYAMIDQVAYPPEPQAASDGTAWATDLDAALGDVATLSHGPAPLPPLAGDGEQLP
ncbi:cell division protein FtsL [Jannaschia sp. LMIT008]|uniref:cell division protein FtsL n=1 Tax=Jannaschia maritima TaxID=3032585 RepID=UPI00281126A3|nr:cell division protein FtsL [Jannaschia sp. LMIT008]